MAEIIKLQAKQTVNKALYYYNRPNTTLIHNLLLNSKVFIWCKSSNQTRPYRLLAIESETCFIQLLNRPTSFKSTSIKPYFQSKTSKTTSNIDLNKLEASLPTLEVSQEFIKPAKPKRGRGRPQKHPMTDPVTKNPVTENHLTSANTPIKQLLSADILVLVQETPFIDL